MDRRAKQEFRDLQRNKQFESLMVILVFLCLLVGLAIVAKYVPHDNPNEAIYYYKHNKQTGECFIRTPEGWKRTHCLGPDE
jgi:hypothetical protein